jgi:hypothetical protein
VPAVLPRDGGPVRRTTATTRRPPGWWPRSAARWARGRCAQGRPPRCPGSSCSTSTARGSRRGARPGQGAGAEPARHKAVTCEGYTDYAGDHRHELQLSRQRSLAVCNALKTYGAQVATSNQGFAGAKPVVIGGQAKLRHDNRRVVVVVNR